MQRWQPICVLYLAFLCTRPAAAQQNGAVVQLPSFSVFSVSTTVSVPVSARGFGRVLAGGNKFAASGRNDFGQPFFRGQNAIGLERRSANMWVSAQVHDLHAQDQYLLRPELLDARRKERREQIARAGRAAKFQAGLSDRAIRSVAAIRRERDAETAAKQREAIALLERGQKAASDGKPGLARIYYQMAARRADGALKSRIVSLLDSLSSKSR